MHCNIYMAPAKIEIVNTSIYLKPKYRKISFGPKLIPKWTNHSNILQIVHRALHKMTRIRPLR